VDKWYIAFANSAAPGFILFISAVNEKESPPAVSLPFRAGQTPLTWSGYQSGAQEKDE
jgi:hypothetical protein